jgi:hypothetical protein
MLTLLHPFLLYLKKKFALKAAFLFLDMKIIKSAESTENH